MKTASYVLLASVLTVLAIYAAAEVGIRTYSALFFPRMMQLDGELGWKHTQNARKSFMNEYGDEVVVVQNKRGHRGRDYELGRSEGKYRILVLGDSFTEGAQVTEEQLFTSRLESLLPDTEVINAGVASYGTVQQYLYLRSTGLKYRPDLVLLMFYNNDLIENCLSYSPGFGPRPYARLENSQVAIIETLDYVDFKKFALPTPFVRTLNRHSYFYNFLNSRVYHRLFAERMRDLAESDWRKASECGNLGVFFELVKLMSSTTGQERGRFATVLIPTREEARAGHSDLQEPIMDFCRSQELHCLELAAPLGAEIANGKELYFPLDIHWTEHGHDVVSREIGAFVRSIK